MNLKSLRSRTFGDFVLFNDNLAVDHYDKSYVPPTRLFMSDTEQQSKALSEWNNIVNEHKSRRELVRDFLISLASSGLNIVVRPHPVYDSLFWHESFRLIPNIQTIYNGCVEPWIHASRAVVTTGCTTGLQALLASKPSFELDISKSNAFRAISYLFVLHRDLSIASISALNSTFNAARQKLQRRWRHHIHYIRNMRLISDSLSSLTPQSSLIGCLQFID